MPFSSSIVAARESVGTSRRPTARCARYARSIRSTRARRVLGLHVASRSRGRWLRPGRSRRRRRRGSLRPCRLADLDLGAEQADVADVMLGAGMVAAGQVDVDRLVERRAAPRGGRRSPARGALVSDAGELAAGVAGAGDQAGADAGRVPVSPRASMRRFAVLDVGLGDVGDQQVLPDGQADRAAAESLGDRRPGRASARPSSGRPAARRRRRTGPAASAGGRRRGRAVVRPAAARTCVERRLRAACGRASSRPRRGTSRSPSASSTYFSRAFLRSVRSPCSMKTRTIAAATGDALVGREQHAGVAGEVLVAGDPAERAGGSRRRARPRRALAQPATGGEADVVGVVEGARPRRRRRRRC